MEERDLKSHILEGGGENRDERRGEMAGGEESQTCRMVREC